MTISNLLTLKNLIAELKLGSVPNDEFRKFIKLNIEVNNIGKDFESKRESLIKEALEKKGLALETISQEDERTILEIVNPLLIDELKKDKDIETKIFTWDTLCSAILNFPENSKLTVEQKTQLTELLCSEDI